MAAVTRCNRLIEGDPFRNDPQSTSKWLEAAPDVKLTRKQSPSSSRRNILIFADTFASMPVQQIELQPPRAVVTGIGRHCRRPSARPLALHVCHLRAKALVALDVLQDHVLDGIQVAETQDDGAAAAEDHSLDRAR